MIRRLTIRRFKRFEEVVVEFPGHIVLAGPNNSGKTTVLQAIATWSLALHRWKQLSDFQRHRGYYTKAPISRQAFISVPMRQLDMLWTDRHYRGTVEIEIQSDKGWTVTMELIADSTEQVYVRPQPDVVPDVLKNVELNAIFVPSMSGLSVAEPVYQRPKIDQLLGMSKPGEVLRNLLVEAHATASWPELVDSIKRLFGYELLPPDARGADILAEYRPRNGGPTLDINSAGSGFQQVLMLLTFLHSRPASVLLLDEPDAHLHVILQDTIFSELQSIAMHQRSQLVVATHSEVVINSVAPEELCMMLDKPTRLSSAAERKELANALRVLPQTDILLACEAPGIIYLEGHTDLANLREWARVLGHPCCTFLSVATFWRETVWQSREDAPGIKAEEHYKALQLVRPDLPALLLLDGDAKPQIPETPITGQGFQRVRWSRYETESYLLHPSVLKRFISQQTGEGERELAIVGLRDFFESLFGKELTAEFYAAPLAPKPLIETYFKQTKARTEILDGALTAAGIHGFPYTRYHEIAALMQPDEIHPEVIEKLNAIQKALRLGP